MPNANPTDTQVREFLYRYTDAMLDKNIDAHALAYEYDIPPEEADEYAGLLTRLDAALVDIEPSRQFKRDLRKELLGEPQPSLLRRLRNLPPRLQFAAGIAILAAMALLGRRRVRTEFNRLLQQLRDSQSVGDGSGQEAKISAG